jgi:hypothetical protein
MKTDSIVQEVRDARASIAAEFGYDLSKYLVWIREQTRLRKESLGNTRQNSLPWLGSAAGIPPVAPRSRYPTLRCPRARRP